MLFNTKNKKVPGNGHLQSIVLFSIVTVAVTTGQSKRRDVAPPDAVTSLPASPSFTSFDTTVIISAGVQSLHTWLGRRQFKCPFYFASTLLVLCVHSIMTIHKAMLRYTVSLTSIHSFRQRSPFLSHSLKKDLIFCVYHCRGSYLLV